MIEHEAVYKRQINIHQALLDPYYVEIGIEKGLIIYLF